VECTEQELLKLLAKRTSVSRFSIRGLPANEPKMEKESEREGGKEYVHQGCLEKKLSESRGDGWTNVPE
jgi:hypothetical protein